MSAIKLPVRASGYCWVEDADSVPICEVDSAVLSDNQNGCNPPYFSYDEVVIEPRRQVIISALNASVPEELVREISELESMVADVCRRCGEAATGEWMRGELGNILQKITRLTRLDAARGKET